MTTARRAWSAFALQETGPGGWKQRRQEVDTQRRADSRDGCGSRAGLQSSSSLVPCRGAKLLDSLVTGLKSESGAGSKMAGPEGLTLWAARSSMPLKILDPWHPLRASFLPHFSPKVTSPSPAQQTLSARMRTVASPYKTEMTLLMILCSSSVSPVQGW